eukprot:1624552-Rhodomonas_salina.2
MAAKVEKRPTKSWTKPQPRAPPHEAVLESSVEKIHPEVQESVAQHGYQCGARARDLSDPPMI